MTTKIPRRVLYITEIDRRPLKVLVVALALAALVAGCATGGTMPPVEVMQEIKSRPISYQQGYQEGWMDAGEGDHDRRNLERMTIDILYAQGYDDGWWDYKEENRSLPGKLLRRIAE